MRRTRSISTILQCTKVVDTYEFFGKTLQIRELLNDERRNTLYIACFEEEIDASRPNVKVITEILQYEDSVCFLFNLRNTYPNMKREHKHILKHLIHISVDEILRDS